MFTCVVADGSEWVAEYSYMHVRGLQYVSELLCMYVGM